MAISEDDSGARGRKDDLAKRLETLLKGKAVRRVLRADKEEVVVELADGTRFFVRSKDGLDISVT